MNEKLMEEFTKECERLNEILESQDTGTDEWEAAFDRKLKLLNEMNSFNKIETEFYTKEADREAQKTHDQLVEAMEDKKQKHQVEIEKWRRSGEVLVERVKSEVDWKKVGIRFVEIMLPLLVTIYARNCENESIMHFEKTEKILTTFLGRQLRRTDYYSNGKK